MTKKNNSGAKGLRKILLLAKVTVRLSLTTLAFTVGLEWRRNTRKCNGGKMWRGSTHTCSASRSCRIRAKKIFIFRRVNTSAIKRLLASSRVCLSVRKEQLCSQRTDFHEIWKDFMKFGRIS